jgi:prophage regulatory protein
MGTTMNLIAANDNRKPTKLLSFAELTTTRGITFSRRHLKRLEDEKMFPLRVVLGENRIGWVVTEVDEWLAARLARRDSSSCASIPEISSIELSSSVRFKVEIRKVHHRLRC